MPPPSARKDEGLPEDAFVYCCLNGMQKITPAVFEAWMRILGQVPGSVLWLLGGPAMRMRGCGSLPSSTASRRTG